MVPQMSSTDASRTLACSAICSKPDDPADDPPSVSMQEWLLTSTLTIWVLVAILAVAAFHAPPLARLHHPRPSIIFTMGTTTIFTGRLTNGTRTEPPVRISKIWVLGSAMQLERLMNSYPKMSLKSLMVNIEKSMWPFQLPMRSSTFRAMPPSDRAGRLIDFTVCSDRWVFNLRW